MKRLLKEDVTRRFMKLANIDTLSEDFMDKTTVDEGKAGDQGRSDVANIVPKGSRWLKEEEEVTEDSEVTEATEVTEEDKDVTEEGYVSEQPEEEPLEDEPLGDVPVDDVPLEDEPLDDAPPEAGGDLDVTSIVQAVTDALAQELEAQGHPVDIDVEGDGEEGLEPLPGEEEEAAMAPSPEVPGEEEEEPVLEDFETAGITVEEELDEEFLNEITKNVAQRLLSLSRGSK